MDTSGIKEILNKVSFLRDYSSLILPVVIGLAGIVLLVLTPLVMGNKLKKQVNKESISNRGKAISSLRRNNVSRDQWREEKKYQDAYGNDANRIILLSEQTSQRELLSYKIFPEPKDTSMLIFEKFGQEFCSKVDNLLRSLRAIESPSQVELDRELERSGSSEMKVSRSRRLGRFYRSSMQVDKVRMRITDALCTRRAASGGIFAIAPDIRGYDFWNSYVFAGEEAAVKDCWYWQLGYWVIEDVVDTIERMNSGSKNVLSSPVKRLLNVSFKLKDQRGQFRSSRSGRSDEDRPYYVLSLKDGLVKSCTGRVGDDQTDIVHFNVIVLVDVKHMLEFMNELCSAKQHKFRGFSGDEQERIFKHNQITILESSMTSISRFSEDHELYRYGDDVVVELSLVCEYIFNKKGYEPINPEAVKSEEEEEDY